MKASWSRVTQRLRADNRLAIMTLFGTVVVISVTPFAIYRLLAGQWLHGLLNSLVVVAFVTATLYAWQSGRIDRAIILVAITTTLGCAGASVLAGTAGLQWMYPMVLGNFLMVRRYLATALSAGGIVIAVVWTPSLVTPLDIASFVVPALVVSLLAYIFASRTDLQTEVLATAAYLDPLTGAFNRRGLTREIDATMRRAASASSPLLLAIIDLDHFKTVNDRHGHGAGDAVLVEVARCLRSVLRSRDHVSRLGGEEFALVLPDVDADRGRLICEKVRLAIESVVVNDTIAVTASIGATAWRVGETSDAWMARADKAMYCAKAGGRNQVVVA